MAGVIWRIRLDGPDGPALDFDPNRDLTLSRLRQIKQWYGVDLGRYSRFVQALAEGDPDAWACAVWIVRKKVDQPNVPEPQFIDLPLGQVMADSSVVVPEADPTPAEAATETESVPEPTPDSTPTPTSSDTATSST